MDPCSHSGRVILAAARHYGWGLQLEEPSTNQVDKVNSGGGCQDPFNKRRTEAAQFVPEAG